MYPKIVFCQKIILTFTNSVDTDEMSIIAAFHLGIHCLQKYLFRGFRNGYVSLRKGEISTKPWVHVHLNS